MEGEDGGVNGLTVLQPKPSTFGGILTGSRQLSARSAMKEIFVLVLHEFRDSFAFLTLLSSLPLLGPRASSLETPGSHRLS